MPEVSNTDLNRAISYLEEAAKLYAMLPRQTVPSSKGRTLPLLKLCSLPAGWGAGKCRCRAHVINELIIKLKSKLPKNHELDRNKSPL